MQVTTSYLIIREFKPGRIEVVCRKTGKSKIIQQVDEPVEFLDLPVSKGYLPFGERPVESLIQLRELRTQVILDYRRAKIKEKKKKGSTPRKRRESALSKRVNEKLKGLNPLMAALLRKELENV